MRVPLSSLPGLALASCLLLQCGRKAHQPPAPAAASAATAVVAAPTPAGPATAVPAAAAPAKEVAAAAGPKAGPAASTPAPRKAQPPFRLVGTYAYTDAKGGILAVDSRLRRVFIGGGMGQKSLIRIEASEPSAMTQTALPYGAGIAVDRNTGRYATTNGYGAKLFVFNADDTPYDEVRITGCGGDLDVDAATGRFALSTQCKDHVAVYSEADKALVGEAAVPGTASKVLFDPGSGAIIENVTPNRSMGNVTAPLILQAPGFAPVMPFTGFVQAVDGKARRLFVQAEHGELAVLDGRTYATLHTFPGLGCSFVLPDPGQGRFYTASTSSDELAIFDAATFARIGTLALPAKPTNLCLVPGDNRLYEIDGSHLYVLQR